MRPFDEIKKNTRVYIVDHDDGRTGCAANIVINPSTAANVIAGWAGGWDHVSVSVGTRKGLRIPTWDEMETVKRIFFRDNEWAMQLHAPPSEHININEFVLHIWRPHEGKIPTPPSEYVQRRDIPADTGEHCRRRSGVRYSLSRVAGRKLRWWSRWRVSANEFARMYCRSPQGSRDVLLGLYST